MTTGLIAGASRGLGAAFAHAVLDRGDNAVVTAHNIERLRNLTAAYPDTAFAVPIEIGDHDRVAAAVEAATARFGGVDVLVNNAGHVYRAAIGEATVDEIDELFTTNFFGPVDLIRQVLPQLHARRSGTIVNVSSIGAPRSNPVSGCCTATKAALEGVSDALRREVEPLGIRVLVPEPDAVRTDFSGRSLKPSRTVISDYADMAGKRREENDTSHGTQPGDPDGAAQVVIDTVLAEDAPFRLHLGTDAIGIVRDELQGPIDEIDGWANISRTTGFDGDGA